MQILSIFAVASSLPAGEDGRYYPDESGRYVHNSNEGQYIPDNSGQYNPDFSGNYRHDGLGGYRGDGSGTCHIKHLLQKILKSGSTIKIHAI